MTLGSSQVTVHWKSRWGVWDGAGCGDGSSGGIGVGGARIAAIAKVHIHREVDFFVVALVCVEPQSAEEVPHC